MKINRNNYESFFLDFIEGRLNSTQQAELKQFLYENPDLKKELQEFENLTFAETAEIKFENKSLLKKSFISVGEINENNYEKFLIGEIENDLTEVEKQNLKKFISKNLFVEKEQKLFQKTILIPDEKINFEDKTSLKKTAVIRLNWQQVSAAVAIAASILLLLYFNFRKENISTEQKNGVAEKKEFPAENKITIKDENPAVKNNLIAENKKTQKEKIIRHKKIVDNEQLTPGNKQNEMLSEQKTVESQPLAEKAPEEKIENKKELNINNIDEKKTENKNFELPTANYQLPAKSDDSFTLKEFLAFKFKKNVLKENVAKRKKETKITPFDLASAAFNGIFRLFGSKIKMNKEYSNGELASVSISSTNFEISRPVHGK